MAKDQIGRILDESNARITQALAGKTIDHVIRNGLDLEIVTTCGHKITLRADTNYNIHYAHTGVQVILPGVSMKALAGKL